MALGKWVKSNVDYGRRLVDSGLEGARSGQEEFLNGEPLSPFLGKTVRGALRPAAVGVGVGLLVSYPISRKKSVAGTILFGLVGGAIGLGLGLAWENRRLSASVAGGAMKSIGKVRDEKWLSKNPINYA
jgi:hypothetical protein